MSANELGKQLRQKISKSNPKAALSLSRLLKDATIPMGSFARFTSETFAHLEKLDETGWEGLVTRAAGRTLSKKQVPDEHVKIIRSAVLELTQNARSIRKGKS